MRKSIVGSSVLVLPLGGEKSQAIIERLQEIRQRIRDRILPASGDE